MFEAGAIAWRLQVIGAEVLGQQVAQADRTVERFGQTAENSGRRLDQAGRSVRDLTKDVQRLNGQDLNTVGRTFIGAGLAVAAMVTLSVVKFAQYDKALDSLGANARVQGDVLDELGEKAIDSGRQFGYTAVEAIGAEEALAKAGVGVQDILGGSLVGSLTLAAAGTLGVANAAEIAAIAMTQFKLQGRDVPHIADLIAAAAGKAVGDVTDIAAALKQSGLVASQFGLSLEDTVGTLAAFAANGLIGSDSGTSFKQMLLSLAAPQGRAAQLMKDLDINTSDAQGKFIGITALAGQLQDKLGGLSDAQRQSALATIFGTDAIRAASVLYEQGSDGLADWISKVDDSGYAAEQARRKLDNLSGDVGKLGSAFDNALIQSGSAANDVLREMVQAITQLITFYADLDPAVQGTVLAFGVGTAAVLLMAGGLFTAVTRAAQFTEALKSLNLTMKGTALAGGAIGAALTAVTLVLGLFAAANAEVASGTAEFADTLDKATGALTQYSREFVKKKLQEAGAYDVAKQLGISQRELTDAVLEGGDAYDTIRQKIVDYGNTINPVAGIASANATTGLNRLRTELENGKDAWQNLKAAGGEAADTAADSQRLYSDLGGTLQDVTDDVNGLIAALKEANGEQIDAREAQIAYLDALSKTAEALADNGPTLDRNTQAGRDNESALLDQAKAAQAAADAQLAADGNMLAYQQTLASAKQDLINNYLLFNDNQQAAEDFANAVLGIPTEANVTVKTDADIANEKLAYTSYLLDQLQAKANVGISVTPRAGTPNLYQANGGKVNFYANGGAEHHYAQFARAGTVRVWAEPETGGEWYIPAAPAKRERSTQILAQAANEFGYQLVPAGGQGFADGGRSSDAQIMSGGSSRPMRIEGTLDLGDGLVGVVRGVINELGRGL